MYGKIFEGYLGANNPGSWPGIKSTTWTLKKKFFFSLVEKADIHISTKILA